jgi:SAM-dependent methyltransferase
VPARTLYQNSSHEYFSEAQLGTDGPLRRDLAPLPVDEEGYYSTSAKYGSPLSYARPMDLMGGWGYAPDRKLRVLDFGCGGVGQMRLLAELGFDVTGVDVDPLLKALYSYPGDTGPIGTGKVSLVIGHYPRDESTVKEVGDGYDLIIAKNTLKKGYIHPERAVDEHLLIHIGVADETFLKTLYSALKPGGRMLVYNISPRLTPANLPLIPWSDGRSPFSREQWELAHFNILALDADDTGPMREYGKTFGWDQGQDGLDLENDFNVLYTLIERPLDK